MRRGDEIGVFETKNETNVNHDFPTRVQSQFILGSLREIQLYAEKLLILICVF